VYTATDNNVTPAADAATISIEVYADYPLLNDPPVAQNDTNTNRWGQFQAIPGGYQLQGRLLLGSSGTAVDFRDSNASIVTAVSLKVAASFNAIEVQNAASRVDWTSVSWTALGTVSRGTFTVTHNADVNLLGCTFVNLSTFTFLSNSSVDGCTFRRTDLITPNGCSFVNNLVAENRASIALTTAASNLSTIQNNTFQSDGTGHAIEITGSAGEYTMVGNQFTGYAGSNGSTGNEAVYVNIASGTVTLNITSGGSTPSIRTAGATVVVNSNVSITLTGLKNPSEVRVFNAGTTTERSGTGNESVTSGSHTFSVPSGTAVDISILSLDYQIARILNYSTTADASIPVSQVIDRQYANP